jgi:hypothetical protein
VAPILRQIIPVHALRPNLFKILFNNALLLYEMKEEIKIKREAEINSTNG